VRLEDQSKHLELQSEDQGKKLERNFRNKVRNKVKFWRQSWKLRVLNRAKDWRETKSGTNEAKLQAQGIDQIQQLDEKLREQSTQQSEQLQQLAAATLDLKMQQKGKDQVGMLEAMLQEQASKTEGHIRQLAGEVTSMKETVEELLKSLMSKWKLCIMLILLSVF